MTDTPTYEELLASWRKNRAMVESGDRLRRRKRAVMSRTMKVFVVAAILLLVGPALAVSLFTQNLQYTKPAVLIMSNCDNPTDGIVLNMIEFLCPSGTPSPLSVPNGLTGGIVSYTVGTLPLQVSAVFLIDSSTTVGSTCGQVVNPALAPIPLNKGTGTLNIGSGATDLKSGDSYWYCFDISSLPDTFSVSVTWSQ